MKKILLLIFIVFTNLILIAQDGYTLNFETENLQGKTIEISYYYGSSRIFYSKDIVAISENKQSVQIKSKSKIDGGIYKLNFIGQKESKDIIIDNGDSLSFGIKSISMKSLVSLNSEKNKLFFLYPDVKTSAQNDSIISTYKKNYPKSIGALYFKLEEKRKNIPAFYSRRPKYQKSYWDSINLNNKQLQYLPNIYRTLNIYNQISPINDSMYSIAMNDVLKKIDKSSPNFEFFLTWYFKNMQYHQQYFLDQTYIKTYKKYFDTLKFEFNNISNFRVLQNTFDDLNANKKGEVISDFKFFSFEDSLYKLSKIYPENDYTFIAFYDPDCFHCQKAIPKLSLFFSQQRVNSDKKIATIGMLNSYTKTGWKQFIDENNISSWINLYSDDPNKQYQEDFNSYANPRFFLVDKKGILISRSGDIKELFRIINE